MTTFDATRMAEWERLRSDDESVRNGALVALWEANGQTMYAVGACILKEGNLAEDAVQEAMRRFIVHLRRIEPEYTPASYLMGVVRNVCLEWLRRRHEAPQTETAGLAAGPKSEEGNDPAEAAEHRERLERLREAVAQLPVQAREVLALKYSSELTNDEIAEALGMRKNAVEVRLHRALKMLSDIAMRWNL